jgi:hypothetical protein
MGNSHRPGRRPFLRRWGRRVLTIAVLAILAYLFRTPLLHSAGSVLVSDDGFAPCTRVAVRDGDRRYEAAAAVLAAGRADGVLIVRQAPARLQEMGLLPTEEVKDRRELTKRGVPDDRIELVPGAARTAWDWARQLGGWLDRHPDATVLVLVRRFDSRHDRLAFRRSLTADQFARVRLAALPHREHDERTWWHHKDGMLAFGQRLAALTHAWVNGDCGAGPDLRTPDELEGMIP